MSAHTRASFAWLMSALMEFEKHIFKHYSYISQGKNFTEGYYSFVQMNVANAVHTAS